MSASSSLKGFTNAGIDTPGRWLNPEVFERRDDKGHGLAQDLAVSGWTP